jgi:putative tryptophan/tyrosine transport system substrate-binding protein
MGFRIVWAIIAIIQLAAPHGITAQPATKAHRLGFLAYQRCADVLDPKGPFLLALRNLGYVQGQNLVIHCRDAIGRFERLPQLAAELVGLNVDVLVTEGTPQSLAGKQATASVPIVMVGVGDPVGSGLVRGFARPGGNITGSAMFPTVDIVVKGLELLKEIAPGASRIAVVWDPANLALVSVDKQLDAATRPLQMQLRRISVQSAGDIENAFATIRARPVEGLLVHPLPVGPAGVGQIGKFALENGLPLITWSEVLAPIEGVLFSYGPEFANVYGRAAGLVDRVLRGANPAELPVEQPSKFGLIINLKTARALRLAIPPSLLVRADRVIE